MNDLAGMEGKGLDPVYNRLVETFDREPVTKSYMRYTAEVEKAQLRMGDDRAVLHLRNRRAPDGPVSQSRAEPRGVAPNLTRAHSEYDRACRWTPAFRPLDVSPRRNEATMTTEPHHRPSLTRRTVLTRAAAIPATAALLGLALPSTAAASTSDGLPDFTPVPPVGSGPHSTPRATSSAASPATCTGSPTRTTKRCSWPRTRVSYSNT